MTYDENLIEIFLKKAVENMFINEPNIYDFTSDSFPTEWNLCHHLAIEIHKFFPEYDVDIEIIKPGAGRTRPDIILHKRGTHDGNFLVVEGKYEDEPGRNKDFDKVVENYFNETYKYKFGVVINFSKNGAADTSVDVFANT